MGYKLLSDLQEEGVITYTVQYFQWNLRLGSRKWIFKAFDHEVQNVEEWTWKEKKNQNRAPHTHKKKIQHSHLDRCNFTKKNKYMCSGQLESTENKQAGVHLRRTATQLSHNSQADKGISLWQWDTSLLQSPLQGKWIRNVPLTLCGQGSEKWCWAIC